MVRILRGKTRSKSGLNSLLKYILHREKQQGASGPEPRLLNRKRCILDNQNKSTFSTTEAAVILEMLDDLRHLNLLPEDSPQMRFPENNNVVKAIATY